MATPAELALMPPIPRELPPEVQAMLLAQRLGIQPPPIAANPMMPPVAPGTGPLRPAAPSIPGPTFPMPAAAPAPAMAAFPGNVPYAGGMGPQRPLGAVINPQAGAPVNPFQGPPEPERAPPTTEGQPVGPAQTQQAKPRRLQAWRDFIQRFKTDPDTRMAVMQSVLALTKPAGNAAEAIGSSLDTGQRTLHALQTQRLEESRQAAADKRAERGVQVQEGELGLAREQAGTRKEQGQQELDLRLKNLEQDAAYQRELLEIRRLEATNGNGQGQVNSRIENLAQTMLLQPDADLLRFKEGPERLTRARLRAFDAVQGAGQTRQKFIADEIARQQLFLPDPGEANYNQELTNLVTRVGAFADAAGLFDERVAPPSSAGPAAPGPLPPGVTEANVQEAMQVLKLTREQVLARYQNATTQ